MQKFQQRIDQFLEQEDVTAETASVKQLYTAVSQATMETLRSSWKRDPVKGKKACYFSAEFLVGRLINSNLMSLNLMEACNEYLAKHGLHSSVFEQIEDDALGNGGLGRLAACFLDSAATHGLPLNGYGIRYRYGLFKQSFENGFQKEQVDDWQQFGDPWSVRREADTVLVKFGDQQVKAVPYDMPIIGYGGKTINTLRLWQAEPVHAFNFDLFNQQKYQEALAEQNIAQAISAVLYPNDDTLEGKKLRLKQQYFFTCASLQSILKEYTKQHGDDFSGFADAYAIQLNDTHPVVAIPELLRILMAEYDLPFEQAFSILRGTFAYTNHTVMSEALEKWDTQLFLSVLPQVYPYIVMIQDSLGRDLKERQITGSARKPYDIISDGQIHMARLAVYVSHCTNGVAQIHSQILKDTVFHDWYQLWPERFQNKTNGITQRRWLALCNPELSKFLTEKVGAKWITNLSLLKKLEPYVQDPKTIQQFRAIKQEKKQQLCDYIKRHEGSQLDANALFDVQIKRLHEYKRQLLNAFSILDFYFGIKEGSIQDFYPMVFLFGAKAAPGYRRAKGIIKFINEIARLINEDPEMQGKMQISFVQNYNVSYAEKLIPAADISEQISTAGTEASGTGNMKLMLNGAVTLGTLDGANVEIVEQAGTENNYIFGATVEEIEKISAAYNAKKLYTETPRIKRVVDTLIDGTFDDDGTGLFRELYDSLLIGASWHKPDPYYLLLDFLPYCETKLRINRDYADRTAFAQKCLRNIANAGKFSSDRTILEYARDIWGMRLRYLS